jgi:colanic acid biosynthesis protein WcaH
MSFLPDETYITCLASGPIVAVDVVLLNPSKTKILLFKRNNKPLDGIFYTIGGRTLKNESIVDTAVRKLKEEAGIRVSKMELFLGGIIEEFFEESIYHGVDTHNVNIFFGYVVSESISIKLDSQHSEYKWFDIKSQDIHSYIQHRIELILSNKCFFYDPRINLPIFGK